VLEAWLREKIPPRDVVLLENGWLDLRGAAFTVVRVPDLAQVLRPGNHALSTADWVVVPETHFANPTLRGLRLIDRVDAQPQTLGGHMGYDYRVYAAPRLAPVNAFELLFDGPDAPAALGPEWAPLDGRRGRRVPRTGGRVYAPPMAHERTTLTLDLADAGGPSAPIPVSIQVDGRTVPLADAGSGQNLRRLSAVMERPPTTRAMSVRFVPLGRNSRIRVVRMQIE
jgi:hypothetical protein